MKEDKRPNTPERCPRCGKRFSGGTTVPNQPLSNRGKVFYMCGGCLSLEGWGSNKPWVVLRNCCTFKQPTEQYFEEEWDGVLQGGGHIEANEVE